MDEQEGPEAHAKSWERFMEAERRELRMRREGHLAKILGPPLPEESPEELERLADEDRLRAEEGLVDLMDESGKITHKPLDELAPEDWRARTRGEGARVDWITERQAKRHLRRPRPGPTDAADR
jgi:hypothetical protein